MKQHFARLDPEGCVLAIWPEDDPPATLPEGQVVPISPLADPQAVMWDGAAWQARLECAVDPGADGLLIAAPPGTEVAVWDVEADNLLTDVAIGEDGTITLSFPDPALYRIEVTPPTPYRAEIIHHRVTA
ncbi:hypothetical protein [Haematobacter massiliensis]|uniref:hypothetical protein n=1 Tax=Haematobacter massiliensis TaxID=195105 RepID=UPI0023EF9DC0|nr:hypothetical protein [Haematobacter massiliensis]